MDYKKNTVSGRSGLKYLNIILMYLEKRVLQEQLLVELTIYFSISQINQQV